MMLEMLDSLIKWLNKKKKKKDALRNGSDDNDTHDAGAFTAI